MIHLQEEIRRPYFSSATLVGNVRRIGDLSQSSSGNHICPIDVTLHQRKRSRNGEWVEQVVVVEVTLFGNVAKQFHEDAFLGALVLVQGSLFLRLWEVSGQPRSAMKIAADSIRFLQPTASANNAKVQPC